MRTKAALAVLMILLAAGPAWAQTKISGTVQCGKPDPQHVVEVTGMASHSLAVEQSKCTWTKPMEIAGLQSKDGVSTATDDISGSSARVRGYHVTNMSNADTFRVSYSGEATTKDGAMQSNKGTWAFIGGSGKLKGLKGKGTYTCAAAGDGISCEVEGEYTLPK